MYRSFYSGIDISTIPLDDVKTLDMLVAADTSGIPIFESEFALNLIKITEPKTFDDFVRIEGLSHNSYTWTDHDRDTEVNYVISEMPPYSEIIAFRDDILMYLLDKGIDWATAYKIMTDVRKGKGLTTEYEDLMTKADVPEWYIKSCRSIMYLFPKAHAVSYTMLAFRIAWFKAHYPEEFAKIKSGRSD
jgi:DNA polymerase-3 subunit alpha (Gram-positive type)